MGNTFGTIFRLTSFGESHGAAVGGIIDGMPANLPLDLDEVQRYVDRRRPGQSPLVTARTESDRVEVLSGIFEGRTLGTPIGFVVRNRDCRSQDYERVRHVYRPSHGDYTYQAKYGHRDHRGGGRSSARETLSRVVAGAFAMQALRQLGIHITAYTSQIGDLTLPADTPLGLADSAYNALHCPDAELAQRMAEAIEHARAAGDTLGGAVRCVIDGVGAGLGAPVFDKLDTTLAGAMMGIPAAKSFDIGDGRRLAAMPGSASLDTPRQTDGAIVFDTNHSGGVHGGISNGNRISFEVCFKPVPTLPRPVETIDDQGQPVTLHAGGRHDVCVVPRAVVIVESMAALVVLDHYLLNKTVHL